MTIATSRGFKLGEKYVVTVGDREPEHETGDFYTKGMVVKFTEDDGSNCPYFQIIEGNALEKEIGESVYVSLYHLKPYIAAFKVGDKVRAVKICTKKDFEADGANNSWTKEMDNYVEEKTVGVIEEITSDGIKFTGDDCTWHWPSAAFELVEQDIIDWTKPVQTTDGQLVEIITSAGRGEYPVVGYIGDKQTTDVWTSNGKFVSEYSHEHAFNLMNVPKAPEQQAIYVNVFKNSTGDFWIGATFKSKEKADTSKMQSSRIACQRVVLTAGQFDD